MSCLDKLSLVVIVIYVLSRYNVYAGTEYKGRIPVGKYSLYLSHFLFRQTASKVQIDVNCFR